MKTDHLIDSLAIDLKPVGRGEAACRLALAIAAGGIAVVALVAILIGDPLLGAGSLDVMTTGVKTGFTLSLVLIATSMLYRSGRPNHDPRASLPWLAAPVLALGTVAVLALIGAPASERSALVFGDSWLGCLVSVTALSVPVFALILLAFKRLAPTDLKLSGMLAGLTAGSTAGLFYALHCDERSPAFLLIWYGLAILAATLAGRALGPRLLRW